MYLRPPSHHCRAVQVTPTQKENLRRFLDWNPLTEERCKECRVLPICMGGCPYVRLNASLGASCAPWRHFLLDTLALRYKMEQLAKGTHCFQKEGGK